MDRFDRIYQLDRILQQRHYPVTLNVLMEEMECSQSTVKRAINALRDYFQAPLIYSREPRGYRYDTQNGDKTYELPGLWFNASELHALLVIDHFLEQIDPGLYKEELGPFHTRIKTLLEKSGFIPDSDFQRIRIINIAQRKNRPHHFRKVAEAVLQRKLIRLEYHSRSDDQQSKRTVSPQRLIHYRDNWYLDAWCHQREALRTFAIDRIHKIELKDETIKDIAEARLNNELASAYGIFSGEANHIATLHFTPERARWVAEEEWHPQQQGQFIGQEKYELKIPYNDPRELIMEVLKHGSEVEVIEPDSLREMVAKTLAATLAQYQ